MKKTWKRRLKTKTIPNLFTSDIFITMGTVAQDHIKAKLITYLHQEKGRDPALLTALTRGHCSGFTCLWLYTKYISTLPRHYNIFGTPILRDDNEWFWKTLRLLSDWNTQRPLTFSEKSDIERLLTQVSHFQDSRQFGIAQGTLEETLCDTSDRKCEREYSLAAQFTLNEAAKTLAEIIYEDRLVLISSHNHDIGLMKTNGIYHLYNPNNPDGEIITNDAKLIAQEIFKAMSFGLPTEHAPLGFRIYHFRENDYDLPPIYPHQRAILTTLSFVMKNQIDIANTKFKSRTALMTATFINCNESINFLLENSADPNRLDTFKTNALMLTLTHGNIMAALNLVRHSADITQKNLFGQTYRDFDYTKKISNTSSPDIIAQEQLFQHQLNHPEIIIDNFGDVSTNTVPAETVDNSSETPAESSPKTRGLLSFSHLFSLWKSQAHASEEQKLSDNSPKTQQLV
jgi:ankyrin repeat protein